jgi:hypothetical protein
MAQAGALAAASAAALNEPLLLLPSTLSAADSGLLAARCMVADEGRVVWEVQVRRLSNNTQAAAAAAGADGGGADAAAETDGGEAVAAAVTRLVVKSWARGRLCAGNGSNSAQVRIQLILARGGGLQRNTCDTTPAAQHLPAFGNTPPGQVFQEMRLALSSLDAGSFVPCIHVSLNTHEALHFYPHGGHSMRHVCDGLRKAGNKDALERVLTRMAAEVVLALRKLRGVRPKVGGEGVLGRGASLGTQQLSCTARCTAAVCANNTHQLLLARPARTPSLLLPTRACCHSRSSTTTSSSTASCLAR